MAHSQCHGVDPVDMESEGTDPPYCPHGPTLVFERYYANREPRKFYACALHRDRKGCSFFHWEEEPIPPAKRERWKAVYEKTRPNLDRAELGRRLSLVCSSAPGCCGYCSSCGCLLLPGEWGEHQDHDVRRGVGAEEVRGPTRLLSPMEERKAQAQFFFSPSTVNLVCSELQRLKFTHLLCVGTPTLHEAAMKTGHTESLLLDVDHRYAQFYCSERYQCYNMFNGFFYEADGEETCRQFLQSDSVAMVIDPPFGGRAEVLGQGIRKLWRLAGRELPTLLVFPYFMESHLSVALPSLTMSDYQVTYENHKHFSSSRKKPKPSPVRLFTNLPPPALRLPPAEGYRFCKLCNRDVCTENIHCIKCNSCTSKDGRRYSHCDQCGHCVKTGRVHCPTCNRCDLPNHSCDTRPSIGCHICGSLEHKRRDCPEKHQKKQKLTTTTTLRKRKRSRHGKMKTKRLKLAL